MFNTQYPTDSYFVHLRRAYLIIRLSTVIMVLTLDPYSYAKLFTCNERVYTAGWNVWGEWFLAATQGNHQNFDPSLLTNKFWLIFMGKKQKIIFFFEKKNSKWPTQKKCIFQKRPFFCENFMDWSFLGLVGLIDMKGIDLSQPIWLWGCLT